MLLESYTFTKSLTFELRVTIYSAVLSFSINNCCYIRSSRLFCTSFHGASYAANAPFVRKEREWIQNTLGACWYFCIIAFWNPEAFCLVIGLASLFFSIACSLYIWPFVFFPSVVDYRFYLLILTLLIMWIYKSNRNCFFVIQKPQA